MNSEYIKVMDELNDGVLMLKHEIGYALFHKEKYSMRSWLWRTIGKLFHRLDWYAKGLEAYNPFEYTNYISERAE